MNIRLARSAAAVLIIGSSGEASLLATLFRGTSVPHRPGGSVATGQAVWVQSMAAATEIASQVPVSRALVEQSLLRGTPTLVDVRGHQIVLEPLTDELEQRLGRIATRSVISLDAFTSSLPLSSRRSELLRRCVDILLSMVVLVVTVPLMVAIALGFRLLFGPAHYFQNRQYVGKDASNLQFPEFAPRLQRLSPGSWRGLVAESVTRNIRRVHLDRAPAFGLVVTGQMSLIGPRPVTPTLYQEAVEAMPLYASRVLIRPGVVSLAWVRMRQANSTYDARRSLEYDLYYIKNRSLRLDGRIFLRAVFMWISTAWLTIWRIATTAVSLPLRRLSTPGANKHPRASTLILPSMPVDKDGLPLNLTPSLLIGAGKGSAQLIQELQANPDIGLWPVALVDDNLELIGGRINGVPVLGTTDAVAAISLREQIETIVIAIPSASPIQKQRLTKIALTAGIPVLTMPAIGQILMGTDVTVLTAVPINDLLGRPVVDIDPSRARSFLGGKRVLVTGAAGSIGREVVFQALRGEPATIYGLDINESDLYDLQQDLLRRKLPVEFIPVVGSVTDKRLVTRFMTRIRPQVVFHAAAYKHVPLMEDHPQEAVRTNIGGTWTVAHAAAQVGAERFVLVSTDKAVRPSSVMGASKRIAELIVRDVGMSTGLSTCAVRFGNVLGSRGSVIPLFERQIEAGGPVTITDDRMTRYFMTISEAAGLIIEAGAFGDQDVVYMLDMDKPVRIVDLADRLIRLKGLRPGIDIAIEVTGLRPGEKLFEELSLDFERAHATAHPKIRILAEGVSERRQSAEQMMRILLALADEGDPETIRNTILQKVQLADGVDLSLISTGLPETSAQSA